MLPQRLLVGKESVESPIQTIIVYFFIEKYE